MMKLCADVSGFFFPRLIGALISCMTQMSPIGLEKGRGAEAEAGNEEVGAWRLFLLGTSVSLSSASEPRSKMTWTDSKLFLAFIQRDLVSCFCKGPRKKLLKL